MLSVLICFHSTPLDGGVCKEWHFTICATWGKSFIVVNVFCFFRFGHFTPWYTLNSLRIDHPRERFGNEFFSVNWKKRLHLCLHSMSGSVSGSICLQTRRLSPFLPGHNAGRGVLPSLKFGETNWFVWFLLFPSSAKRKNCLCVKLESSC